MKTLGRTLFLSTALAFAAVIAAPVFAQMPDTGPTPYRDNTPLGGGFKEKNKKSDQSKKTDYQTARQLMQAGNNADAVPVLLRVVANDPRIDAAWNDLGYASQQLGRNAEAAGYYERALSIKPGRKDTRARLGEVHLALNNLPKAEEQLNQLKQICTSGCDELHTLEAQITAYKAVHPA